MKTPTPEEDVVYPFEGPLFSKSYRFDSIIAVPTYFKEKRIIILKYLHVLDQTPVAVKCLPASKPSTEKELATLFQVEQMRARLGLECIVHLRGYARVTWDPFQTYANLLTPAQRIAPERGASGSTYWNVVMDYVPLTYKQLDRTKMNPYGEDEVAVSLLVHLLYTLWKARRDAQFFHGDINVGNIMFVPLEYAPRIYQMENMELSAHSPYLPVLVDFEKSKFGTTDKKENMSDVRNIITAVGEIMEHYGIPWSADFVALRDEVIDFAFKDSRFQPETIVKILRESDLFIEVREESEGKEPPGKVIVVEECIQCGKALTTQGCQQCGAPLCSQACSLAAWKGPKSCHWE